MQLRKYRKKSLLATLTGLCSSAWAWLVWIAVVLVILFVAVIVYKLVQCIRHVNPRPAPPDGNVSRVFIDDDSGQHLAYSTFGTNDPAWVPSGDATLAGGFTISYGMTTTNLPWVTAGANMGYCLLGPITGDSNCYSYTITLNGQYVQTVYDTTNGFTSQVLDEDSNFYTVVIERSPSLTSPNWQPVFTNDIQRLSVDNWTDAEAPQPAAFYRLNYKAVTQ